MELRHIRYFITLSEELHFRKAAEKLFIAQPALSRQIMELEEELGVKLFIRNKRKVSLTLAGIYLQKEGYKVLKQIELIKTTLLNAGKTLQGTLTIGHIGSAINIIIPDFLAMLKDEMPGIRTTLVEGTTNELSKLLSDGKADIAFCREVTHYPDLISTKIYEESTVLAVAKNNKWQARKSTPVQQLAAVPFILYPRNAGPAFRAQIEKICALHNFHLNIVHESIHSNTIIRLVEKDLGISILPKSLTKGYDLEVEFIEHAELAIPVELFVAIRKDENDEIVKEAFNMVARKALHMNKK